MVARRQQLAGSTAISVAIVLLLVGCQTAPAVVAEQLDAMVPLPGGWFDMGSDEEFAIAADGESPVRRVFVDAFWLDETEVSVRSFAAFVAATGHRTAAENYSWSFCLESHLGAAALAASQQAVAAAPHWLVVHGSDWRHPEGPDGDDVLRGGARLDEPVVHVSWDDARAYCGWQNKRLPSEAEWEFAARGGLANKRYCWGDALTMKNGSHWCNSCQGACPLHDRGDDGYRGVAPVRAFPPNGYGLYNMCGNVWEWTADVFTADRAQLPLVNPVGPPHGSDRVQKGGSFMCHRSTCFRQRPSSRVANQHDSSAANLGFRCARSAVHPSAAADHTLL